MTYGYDIGTLQDIRRFMEVDAGRDLTWNDDFMRRTDIESQRKYYAVVKAMPRDMKHEIAMRLTKLAKNSQVAALKRKFPSYNDHEIKREYLRNTMEPDQFRYFYPDGMNIVESLAHLQKGNA